MIVLSTARAELVYAYPTDLDPTFGHAGIAVTPMKYSANASALAIQPDGKIVLAGSTSTGASTSDFVVIRYTSVGQLDPTFGNDGIVITDFAGGIDAGLDMALQPDGKIIVVGQSTHEGPEPSRIALARYTADGHLDPAFANTGAVLTSVGSGAIGYAVALQSDGKIVVAGQAWFASTEYDFAVLRYNPDGALDATYAGDGIQTTDFRHGADRSLALGIQADGKIVLAGEAKAEVPGEGYDFALARYTSDGSLDVPFGQDVKVTTDFVGSRGSIDSVSALALQVDGNIMVVGSTGYLGCALARYTPNGDLDLSFSGDGMLTTYVGNSGCLGNAILIQPDGKILVAGDLASSSGSGVEGILVRYSSDGRYDPTFAQDGVLIFSFGERWSSGQAIAVQADAKIVVAGYTSAGKQSSFAVARYQNLPYRLFLPGLVYDRV